MSEQQAKRIPYGSADFGRMRQDNSYYVDKTRFIPLLEAQPYFVFLIRPRRFGKTLWLSTLQHYYDVNRREQFEQLFGGTYIGEHPTTERNSYFRNLTVRVVKFCLWLSDAMKGQRNREPIGMNLEQNP